MFFLKFIFEEERQQHFLELSYTKHSGWLSRASFRVKNFNQKEKIPNVIYIDQASNIFPDFV